MDAISLTQRPSIDQIRHLYRFMACRSFVASREQLVSAGFTCSRINNLVRTGRLIRAGHGVYILGRDVETPEAAFRVTLLAAGRDSALTGRSACQIRKFISMDPGLPRVIEVAVPCGKARRIHPSSPALRNTRINVIHRGFGPNETSMRNRLTVVTPTLALIDFAVTASEREVRFAFLEACRLNQFVEADVTTCYNLLAGRRGAKKLRPNLVLWVPELSRTNSVFEGWFLLVWVDRGYPMPKVNEKVYGYEVDFFWPEQKMVVEVDGNAFHSDPAQKRIDLEKQRDLEAHGLDVRRITYGQFERNPYLIADRLARDLGFA